MEILNVQNDGVTELETFNTLNHLSVMFQKYHMCFFSKGDLYIISEITKRGKVYGIRYDGDIVVLNFQDIERYTIVEE